MKKFLLTMLVLVPLVVGCASTKKVQLHGPVLSYVPAGGGASAAPAVQTPAKKKGGGASIKKTPSVQTPAKKKGVEQQQQYNRSAPVVEEGPHVLGARAIRLQTAEERKKWKEACTELTRDIYLEYNYETCREFFGDEPGVKKNYGYRGHGRSVGGSVIGNSRGRVNW